MSDTIQNKMLQILAHAIQRHIITEAEASNYFGLTADGTTDTNGFAQFSCNLQFVDDNLAAQNIFHGFAVHRIQPRSHFFYASRMFSTRLSLPLEKL